MRDTSPGTARVIEWGVAMRTLPGEAQCGDVHLVKPIASGVLLAFADGLGHGEEAAAAARAAVTALERHAGESPLALVERSHRALHGTRGAVLSLALVNRHERSLTWLGVGNVEGTLLYGTDGARRRRATLITRGGIVGSELPRLQPETLRVAPGDTLIFATDGIREGFAEGLPPEATPQQVADHILAQHGKGTDDALALVARFVSGAGPGG